MIQVGDTVKVIERRESFPSYISWFELCGYGEVDYLSSCNNGENGVVVCTGKHKDGIRNLIGVRKENNMLFIINESGVELVEKKQLEFEF